MTETRTAKFGLPQWSAGTDGPSRADFNEAFLNIENRAAYDDGASSSGAPSSGLVAGRYFWQAQGAGPVYRTLWRADGSNAYVVGGPTIPTTQLFRGNHSSVSGDANADAIRIEHPLNPDDGGWGGQFTYAGSGYLRTGLALGDDDDTAAGRLAVGAPALPGSTVRMSVDSYGNGEHAIVSRVRHATPGNIFRGLNAGGSAVFTVDGTGRVQAPSPSAFGSAPLPTTAASLAVAPTSGGSGTVSALTVYGLTAAGDAGDVDKALFRAYLDATTDNTVPIVAVNRLGMQLGRITWGTPGTDGTLRFDANAATFRTYGGATGAARTYYAWKRAHASTPDDLGTDTTLVSMNADRMLSDLPLVVSQRLKQSATTLTLQRLVDYSAPMVELYRLDGVGETPQLASTWASDGKLRTGAWWKSTGTVREVRQSIRHRSTKIWASPGSSPFDGIELDTLDTYTYTFGTMTLRSSSVTDILVTLEAEILLGAGSTGDAEGQVYGFECRVSVNGGTFTAIDQYEENASVAMGNVLRRSTGDKMMAQYILGGVAAGATVQVRIIAKNGQTSPSLFLRKYVIDVEECLIETYTAP